MDRKLAQEERIGLVGNLPASGTVGVGAMYVERGRTLAITCKVTYNSSATSGITVKLYYNHEDIGLDTVPFASFVPTLTAGETVQRTVLIDPPEGQNLEIKITNDDATYAATNIEIGYSIKRWEN